MKHQEGSGSSYYQCTVCQLHYAEKEWADRCEAWCREHASCNTEIIQHAVKMQDPRGGKMA